MSLLVGAVGRRGSLVALCAEVSARLDDGRVVGTDASALCAAGQRVDALRLVPGHDDPFWLDAMLDVCREEAVTVLFPTIDTELALYAEHVERFREIGTRVMVSSAETVRICGDKKRFHAWCSANALPVPRQWSPGDVLADPAARYPMFFKPVAGSSSVGADVVRSAAELETMSARHDGVVQELLEGEEYTVDAYVDAASRVRCAVPRLRLAVRGGEVSKGVTVRDPAVMELASALASALPDAVGVVTVQVMKTAGGPVLIEANARLGGGYPLAHRAGADLLGAAVLEARGESVPDAMFGWREGLIMLRHDVEVYLTEEDVRQLETGRRRGS